MAEKLAEKQIMETKRSPYFLSSSDNPGMVLTHVQLKGENYEEWAKVFKGSLRAKTKVGFIDGTIDKPTNAEEIELWQTVNSMVVSWIFNTIEPSLRSTITYVEDAKVVWDDLQERFSVGNGPRVQQLKSDLANCKQQKGESVAAYYGRVKKLWDELNDFEALLACSCAGCRCNISTKLSQRREEEKVHQFVMGLETPRFENVKSNILSTEPLPTVNKAYSMVTREERVRGSVHEEYSAPMSFVVQTVGGSTGQTTMATTGGTRGSGGG